MVTLESWQRPAVTNHSFGRLINFERGDARLSHGAKFVQYLAHEPACGSHLVNFLF